jgi:putative tricarboxylic transport membrane protein
MRGHLIAGTGVAFLAAVLAAGLPSIDAQGGYSGLSPRFLPTVVTVMLGALAVLLMLNPASVPRPDSPADAKGRSTARLLTLLAGLLLHMALVGLLGFIAAGTLLMVLVARGFGSRRPMRDALVGLALTLPLWLVFTRLLGLALPLLPLLGR